VHRCRLAAPPVRRLGQGFSDFLGVSGRGQGDPEGKGEREFEVAFGTTLCINIRATGTTIPASSAGAKRALADEQGMGIILMRVSARCGSWTSGVFQRLMAEALSRSTPPRKAVGVGRLLLNSVLSDLYVDVALVEGRGTHLRELRFVEMAWL
jgi:hypothetical protein